MTEVWKHDHSLKLTGTDIHKDTVILGNVNMLMNTATLINDDDSVIISKTDSIRNQNIDQYDYILTNPPYGLRVTQKDLKEAYKTNMTTLKSLYPYSTTSSVELFQQCLLKKMRKQMVMVVPFGNELYGRGVKQINLRKHLLDTYCLEKVILLPSGSFEYTSIQTCIMFWKHLSPEESHTPHVDFYQYNPETNDKTLIKQVLYDDLKANKYSLNIKEYTRVEKTYSNEVVVKTLGEICEFKRGKSITKKDLVPGEYPVIGGGQSPLGTHNKFNIPEKTILVSKDGAYAGYVSIYPTKVFISGHCFAIIPKTMNKQFLYYYLKFIQDDIYKLQTGAAQPGLNPSTLENLKIPIPSMEVQTYITNEIRNRYHNISVYTKLIKMNNEKIKECVELVINQNASEESQIDQSSS